MQYSRLGNTGLVVSRLSFGAMTFTAGSQRLRAIAHTEGAEADRLVGRALDAGVNFFDTADVYSDGQSEEMLGRALAARRKDVVIATKVGGRMGKLLTRTGLSKRHIAMSIDESLARLGTDWVDVYIAHRHDPATPLEETLEALDAVVRAGKERYLGVSNWPAWRIAAALELQKANGWAPFSHAQLYYSMLGRDIEQDYLPLQDHYGVGLTVWSPLAGGFLSGKYRPETLKDEGGRYAGLDIFPFDKQMGFALVERLRGLAAERGVSVAQVALAWLLAKRHVSSVIVGASRLDQLDDNLGSIDVDLDPATVAALDEACAIPKRYPNWFIDSMGDRIMREAIGVG